MQRAMKIYFADFQIAKYGGIVSYVADMLKAFRDLGCVADVIQITPTSITQKAYDKKIEEFESGVHQEKIKFHSQSGGYERDGVTGYWRNNYYGYFLPPSNRIGAYERNAIERWKDIVKDADIILWNFIPTKSSVWKRRGIRFDFWWRFFDLPASIKQVFLAHDAYFDVRASNVSAFKDKILFLGCAHLAAYRCCAHIGMPRTLLLNPRYLPDGMRMPIRVMTKRSVDFFAAHMFKSMKHMEELVAAVPYVQDEYRYNIEIAGTGIEYSYMTSETKIKDNYICSSSRDPDLPKELDKKMSLWDRAISFDMKYMGQMSGSEVINTLRRTKFAIDPSWSEHYAHYSRTHINGFIIEAMLNGAYPVLRDYRGLSEDAENVYDPLFENIKAIIIPWNATPREFAEKLKDALKMTPSQYFRDTKSNFDLAYELFNAKNNAQEIIRLCSDEKAIHELEVGIDSDTVKNITADLMTNFFDIKLPIKWSKTL